MLTEGDLVLVRIHVCGGEDKAADKWEQAPWEVTHIKEDSPLITLRNTRSGEVRELHRNMYPLRMVDNTDDNVTTLVLAKANVITEDYFAYDCRNCRDIVEKREGVGGPTKNFYKNPKDVRFMRVP